mmetsp:Transcript_60303/g.123917  ORF Transcript_60303/g.123917 Transcript_60303/m.123917 type:complete len:141 (+) Transcript_60303:2086-2508(+)
MLRLSKAKHSTGSMNLHIISECVFALIPKTRKTERQIVFVISTTVSLSMPQSGQSVFLSTAATQHFPFLHRSGATRRTFDSRQLGILQFCPESGKSVMLGTDSPLSIPHLSFWSWRPQRSSSTSSLTLCCPQEGHIDCVG